MPSLKDKTISGLTWSFIDNFSSLGIQFIVGIVLARLLSPKEFGLIGLITIFIAISATFIDSGFSNSLIRKKDCTQKDYSTIFYFNLLASVILYLLLYFLAIPISDFFSEPKLVDIIRIIGISLILSSFGIIQRAILTKRVDFKLQTKVSVITSLISGGIAIYMAYTGYGVWSLVWKTISAAFITSLLLWLWNRWYPHIIFNYKIFKEHFKFGYKLLLSGIINTLYLNIYYIIIGKYFSTIELGYYTRAEQFSNLPSSNITGVVSRVSYPVLSQLQSEPEKLKEGYDRIIKTTMFISFILMFGLAAAAKPFVLTLIGEKWINSVLYLQLLCFSGMLYPLHALNLNILNVKGRSDLFLRLEVFKKLLAIPVILVAIFMGIKSMLIGFIILSFVTYFVNAYWSGKLIDYSFKEQVIDLVPSFLLSVFIGLVVFGLGFILDIRPVFLLILQISIGGLLTIILSQIMKIEGYIEIRNVIKSKLAI